MNFYKNQNKDEVLDKKYATLMNTPINMNVIDVYVVITRENDPDNIKIGKIVGFDKYHRCILDISLDIFEEKLITLPVFWGNLRNIDGRKLSDIFGKNKVYKNKNYSIYTYH